MAQAQHGERILSSEGILRLLRSGALCVVAPVLVGACARIDEYGLLAFSSKADAYAIVNGHLLEGGLRLYPDRTGLLTMEEASSSRATAVSTNPASQAGGGATSSAAAAPAAAAGGDTPLNDAATCQGRMRYTGTGTAVVNLHCYQGISSDVEVVLMSETRGYGSGRTGNGAVSLAFGMEPMEAAAHLSVPPGQRLRVTNGTLALEAKTP